MTRPRAKPHYWSKEEIDYLKEIAPGRYTKEITQLMNEKFGLELRVQQIKVAMKRRKIKSGVSSRWEKGHVPYNKGTKGASKVNKGSFKEGNKPINTRPIGAERDMQGYIEVKVSEKKWVLKQRVLYEQYHNVKLEPNQVVIFLNTDKTDFSKENLYLIDRKTMMCMTRERLWSENEDLNKTGVKIAELLNEIGKRQKVKE